jgi:hypothetical protein
MVGPSPHRNQNLNHSRRGLIGGDFSGCAGAGAAAEEMIKFVVPVVLVAAAVAGCITYFVTPAPPVPVEADQRSPPAVPGLTDRLDAGKPSNTQRSAAENHIVAFERAAEAILKNAKASAGEPAITGPIPLPRRRPVLAP